MFLRGFLVFVIFCFSLDIFAIGNFKPTEAQLRLLPDYCKSRAEKWGNDKKDPRVKRWYRLFGGDWIHMHHYCNALNSINKGDRALDERKKSGNYNTAIRELSYSEKAAKGRGNKFILLPELYAKKGDVYVGLGDDMNAEQYYRKSIRYYPKYSTSYKLLINLLIRNKRFEDAKKINDLSLKRFKKRKFFYKKEKIIERGLKGKKG